MIDTHETILKIVSPFIDMASYSFSGKIQMGKFQQKFEKEVEAESEKHAKEKLYSELGSEHNVTRGQIELE